MKKKPKFDFEEHLSTLDSMIHLSDEERIILMQRHRRSKSQNL